MSKFTGTVSKNDLEGGFWELTCASGERYQLQGGDGDLKVEGQKVEVEGEVASATMGIGMVGSILNVKSWKKS
tara:strand:+ start:13187 stop:13405 length:219 start_codon:yes stop_codon:yes gene_type:complete